MTFRSRALVAPFVLALAAGCSGEETQPADPAASHRVGGSVSGLAAGTELLLTDSGDRVASVTADGEFELGEVAEGERYAVGVLSQPQGQACTVSDGTGTMQAGDVHVEVACAPLPSDPTYALGGTVSGLDGGSVVLLDAIGGAAAVIEADGSFTVGADLADGQSYDVRVAAQPDDRFCTVDHGQGRVDGADVSDMGVSCTSDDTRLAALAILEPSEALAPDFDPAVTIYEPTVGLFTDSVRVQALASDAAATITVDGVPLANGAPSDPIALEPGATGIVVSVTAESGRSASYVLMVQRAPDLAAARYVKASNSGSSDDFGRSVAISGDTMVVGAPLESSSATGIDGDQADNGAPHSGAVYVFVRSDGGWTQQAYIKASNTESDDGFGRRVTIDGDTLVVGAWREDSSASGIDGDEGDNGATDSGAAYVFVRSGGAWAQQAYVKASNTGANDNFGAQIAVSGDTLVVGAPHEGSSATGIDGAEGNDDAPGAGAAYVFVRSGGAWAQQAYLKAAQTDGSDYFGASVAVDGDTIAIGVSDEDSASAGVGGNPADNSLNASGAAYVFLRSGGTWSQQAYLKASNPGANDFFGVAIALDGDTLVVGASEEDSAATGVNGNQGDNSGANRGAAYVFVRQAGSWAQQAYLKSTSTLQVERFGGAVAVSGDRIAVGAPMGGSASGGAAYVYSRHGMGWSADAELVAPTAGESDDFGFGMAVADGTVVVGAPSEDSNAVGIDGDASNDALYGAGAAYIFR